MLSWRARHHDHGILYGASGRSQSTRTTDTSNRVGRRRCHWRRCTNTAACCYRRCRLLRRRSKHTILHFQLLTPLSVLSSPRGSHRGVTSHDTHSLHSSNNVWRIQKYQKMYTFMLLLHLQHEEHVIRQC